MAIGQASGIGSFWSNIKSTVSTAIGYLSTIPSGAPYIGGAASVVKIADKIGIPAMLTDDDIDPLEDDTVRLYSQDKKSSSASTTISRIFEKKVFGIPIVPLMLGGVALTFVFGGKK